MEYTKQHQKAIIKALIVEGQYRNVNMWTGEDGVFGYVMMWLELPPGC